MQPNPQKRQSPAGTELHVAQHSISNTDHGSNERLFQPVGDSGLMPYKLARHIGALLDCLVDSLCCGQPVGTLGRRVLKDSADRLRELSQVLR